MQSENLIPANEFCSHYNVEFSFINSLRDFGFIEVFTIRETQYIDTNQLHDLEQIIRLHYDLDINLEGIEAIHHLLKRVQDMQDEIISLKNKLRLYERNE